MSITFEAVEGRKKQIVADIQTVHSRIRELDAKKLEDVALLNALQGALQQCELFSRELHDETAEAQSDVENSSEED